MNKNTLSNAIKGLAIGGSMLVPGVSGGTMAIILGIYDELVTSVSSFLKHKKKSIIFLLTFCIGAIIGILLFSRPILYLIENFELPMMYFFMGAVAGGVPLIFREAHVKRFSIPAVLFTLLGVVIVIALSLVSNQSFVVTGDIGWLNMLMLVVAGIIVAVALVLPGISASYMLLILGIYDITMRAITQFELMYIIPLAVGCLLGIVLTTKILEYCMTKHPFATYLIILGFIIGSIVEIFPGIPTGINWLFCPILFIAGFLIIHMLTKMEAKNQSNLTPEHEG